MVWKWGKMPQLKWRRFGVKTNQKAIDELVQRIVEIVHPLRIILFGSTARGEMGSESDIDVLVVMPSGTHRRKIAQLLYQEARGIGVPFDIIVATPEDLTKHKDNLGLIYWKVLKEGRDVYVQ